MLCPKCKSEVRTIDTLQHDKENEIFRKRQCNKCKLIFYTVEFDIEETSRFKKEWAACDAVRQKKFRENRKKKK